MPETLPQVRRTSPSFTSSRLASSTSFFRSLSIAGNETPNASLAREEFPGANPPIWSTLFPSSHGIPACHVAKDPKAPRDLCPSRAAPRLPRGGGLLAEPLGRDGPGHADAGMDLGGGGG